MQKFLAITLCGVLGIGLTACGSQPSSSANPSTTASETTQTTAAPQQ